jgi:hypothetical protein
VCSSLKHRGCKTKTIHGDKRGFTMSQPITAKKQLNRRRKMKKNSDFKIIFLATIESTRLTSYNTINKAG